jgi:hypothetical protein
MGLAGCVTAPAPYGNFAQNTDQANNKKIADDAVKQLVALYPPASTRFDLQHATADIFGLYLIESMRLKGFAVLESKPESNTANVSALLSAKGEVLTTSGLALSYIFDQAKDSDLYRLTLVINHQQSLGRVYQLRDGTMYPAGYWVHKE